MGLIPAARSAAIYHNSRVWISGFCADDAASGAPALLVEFHRLLRVLGREVQFPCPVNPKPCGLADGGNMVVVGIVGVHSLNLGDSHNLAVKFDLAA